jgi:hypothetical protein
MEADHAPMSDARTPDTLASLRDRLYGDAGIGEWAPHDTGTAGEPWTAFDRARTMARAGQTDEAAELWWQIAHTDGLESRHTLQAWHFLRQAGRLPEAERAKAVLGVVIEMPVGGAHDRLAAYADGSARYINHSGKAAIVEDRSNTEIQQAIQRWIALAATMTPYLGPWTEPTFPPLGSDEARIVMLTPSGPHFGQGPAIALTSDAMAGAFIKAATAVLELIVARAID